MQKSELRRGKFCSRPTQLRFLKNTLRQINVGWRIPQMARHADENGDGPEG